MILPKKNLIDFLRKSPLSKSGIDFSTLHQENKPRDIDVVL